MKTKFKQTDYVRQRELSDGSWSFQVRVPNRETKTFKEKYYGSARRAYDEAVIYRNNQLVMETPKHENNTNITIAEVFDLSFDYLPIREETKRKHLYFFKNHFNSPNKPLYQVTRADIVSSLNDMIGDNSDDNIARVLSIWRRIFKTAIINEYLDYDLTIGVVAPKSKMIKQKKRDVLTDRETLNKVKEELSKFSNKKELNSINMALETMWYTGMRPAECFALNKSDINNGFISVTKELGSEMAKSGDLKQNKLNSVRQCKTEASVREIPISSKLQALLSEYIKTITGDILFPDKDDSYFYLRYVGDRIRRTKIPFNMYRLRHTVATHLVVDGNVDKRTIMEILGHENIDMSVYYARSNEEKKRNVLEGI